jgi:penicillin amidase
MGLSFINPIRFMSSSVLLLVVAASALAASREEITIYRDEFGTPHVYATTAEGACFGHGYAQATDRLEELLKQYMRSAGTMSEAFGPEFYRDDYRQRLYRHAAIAKEKYPTLDAKSRALIEAYQAGVKLYMKEHPSEVPDWAPEIEPWMCVALGRYIIWGWPEGEAGGDLERSGIKPDPVEYHGSNQWLVAADRTAYKAPIALIDPHLSWYGAFRFYEARLYGGEIEFSGMAILGNPLPALGHSRYCSIAMTTGGPDTSDVYEEELNPDNPRQYRYDGQWVDMEVKPEVIRVKAKDGDAVTEKKVELEYTRHGPVVARKDGKAYVFAIPYASEVGLAEQTYRMATARNLAEMKKALSMLQLMMQNVMIGTVDGDIFYVRNGRVPIRAEGFDHKRAMPGNTSKSEWRGIHPFADLVQVTNPRQGYMQNCNVSPQFIMRDSGLKPSPEWPYLFNGFENLQKAFDNPLHQRAAMCVDLLHDARNMTIDQAIEIAMSPAVYGADAWQEKLRAAWAGASAEVRADKDLTALYELIVNWSRRCEAENTGAVAYKYWKQAFPADVVLADRAGMAPPTSATDDVLIEKLKVAAGKLKEDFGRFDVPYGEVYRVGRAGTDRSWPVSGGSVNQIATPRAISFDPIEGTKKYLGRGGQTSTQIVLLTKPPKSWTVLPLGESDDKDGPHYDDQARRLFSKGTMKPTYFLDKDAVVRNAESKTVVYRDVN